MPTTSHLPFYSTESYDGSTIHPREITYNSLCELRGLLMGQYYETLRLNSQFEDRI